MTTGAGTTTVGVGVLGRIRTVCTTVSTYGVPTCQASRMASRRSERVSMRALTSSKVAAGGAAYGDRPASTCATPLTTSPSASTP